MSQVQVTIVEGRNFKKKDFFSENDPFVEIYFDDKKQKQKTKVLSNTKNPRWNETLVLNHIHGDDILHVNVYDKDLFKKDKIGSVQINLQELYNKKHLDRWYHLSSDGEIHLILDYQPLDI